MFAVSTTNRPRLTPSPRSPSVPFWDPLACLWHAFDVVTPTGTQDRNWGAGTVDQEKEKAKMLLRAPWFTALAAAERLIIERAAAIEVICYTPSNTWQRICLSRRHSGLEARHLGKDDINGGPPSPWELSLVGFNPTLPMERTMTGRARRGTRTNPRRYRVSMIPFFAVLIIPGWDGRN